MRIPRVIQNNLIPALIVGGVMALLTLMRIRRSYREEQ